MSNGPGNGHRKGSGPRQGGLTAKGARTRAAIVEAAAGLMALRGAAGTSIEDVIAAAGVSSSQIYHYFSDKSALVTAVIDYQTQQVMDGQEPMLAGLDSLDALRAWRDSLVEHQQRVACRGGCPIASLGSELAETDDTARRQVAASMLRWESAIRAGLQAMRAAGGLTPDSDPGALALATLAAVQGGQLLSQLQRDPRPLATALDAMLTLIGTHATGERPSPAGAGG